MGRPSKPSKRRRVTPKSKRGAKKTDGRPLRTRQLGMSVHGTSWYELPSGRVVQVSTLSEMERCQRTDKST
jgi:hypothetical protein